MTKGKKKTNRRLKKTVRKTLGTLFLISAIVVAAIPTEGLRAETDIATQAVSHTHADTHTSAKYKVSIRRNAAEKQSDLLGGSNIPTMDTLIPEVAEGTTIYTTGTNETDGSNYQFAYIQNGGDWSAILLGYNKDNTLPNNTLSIPNTVNAYIQPTGNLGTGNGYVAANRLGDPLYYEATTERTREVDDLSSPIMNADESTQATDAQGNPLYNKKLETYLIGEIKPCYATDNAWKNMDVLTQFFYYKEGATGKTVFNAEDENGDPATYANYANALDSDHQWIKDGKVRYIGNQYLDSTLDPDSNTYKWSIPSGGGYITEANASKGIFAQAGNIGTLIIGEDLIGIGNCAFYECTGLDSISFGNGIKVIGNYAFASCGSLRDVAIPDLCSLGQIGDHAFYSCTNLTKFTLPINVSYVGDYAFAECRFLSDFVMCNYGDANDRSNLTELGWNVFENCETLSSLTFPANYNEAVDISLVKGCKNLRYITARSKKMTFTEKDGDVYCFDCFKEMLSGDPVNGTFYFEGRDDSTLHSFTRENCFAFSYIDYNSETTQYEKLDKYELTVQDPNVTGEEGRSTYVVNSNNELISSTIGTGVEQLDIPDPIGPYHIYRIGANRFANNCNLKLVSLPASVVYVGDNAFKGCHNLATVIFNNSSVEIGTDAFKTQDYTGAAHRGSCTGVKNESDNSPSVKLTFVGEVSPTSTPYLYAMSEDGRYNNGSQLKTYVRYCSGWPTNLVVQYNEEKGVSELIDFPAFSQLSGYTNETNYPYLTEAQRDAASTALDKYTHNQTLTEDQQQFIDSALNVVIPEGIQAIKDGLFVEKENADAASLKEDKTVTIYGLDTIEANDFRSADGKDAAQHLKAVNILGNTASIAANAFEGCVALETVNITGNMSSIGDYAFKDCPVLDDVTLSGTINSLGLIPFTGCDQLSNVTFLGNDYFSCDESIIYGMSGGAKARIIECLEGRTSKYVKPSELAGVTSIAPRAFQGCDNLREIDLTESSITTVPEYAFADTTEMRTIKLPTTCTTIEDYAFQNSGMERLEASQYLNLIGQHAFDDLTKADPDPADVVICSPEDSYLYNYAKLKGFTVDTTPLVEYFTVNFRDWNESIGENGGYALVPDAEQRVKGGDAAIPPTPAGKSGETFQYWDPDPSEITADTVCTAIYSKDDPDANKLTVTFQDWDGTTLKEIKVSSGGSIADEDLPNMANKVRDGYVFIGWDRPLTNITESFITMAQYKALSEDDIVVRYINSVTKEVFYQTTIKKGSVAPSIQTPTVSGYTFKEWLPDIATAITENTDFYAVYETSSTNGSTSPSPGASNSPAPGNSTSPSPGASSSPGSNNGTTAKMYTLTVKNGSGSGSYVAGSQPIIVANDPAANQQFSSWSIDPANTTIASKVLSATVITMPSSNVTVTANYTAKTGSNRTSTSTGSGNSTNSNSNRRPNSTTTGNVSGGRTTVVIDKNGLSNTGVVSATVNGSSDNFVIKITESASASEEVVKALMAEYGSDISAIKYFPMDISLYDSTGNTKITDTTGLSISITLPIPDSLITYAGNNKVAGVVNSKLDKLTPKFSTISGVSCITFTAEHFSPYVIYVDTNNLTAGTIADSTPKTGDAIHPKWFLSLGLACLSMVFFMKKDKKTLRKARA